MTCSIFHPMTSPNRPDFSALTRRSMSLRLVHRLSTALLKRTCTRHTDMRTRSFSDRSLLLLFPWPASMGRSTPFLEHTRTHTFASAYYDYDTVCTAQCLGSSGRDRSRAHLCFHIHVLTLTPEADHSHFLTPLFLMPSPALSAVACQAANDRQEKQKFELVMLLADRALST